VASCTANVLAISRTLSLPLANVTRHDHLAVIGCGVCPRLVGHRAHHVAAFRPVAANGRLPRAPPFVRWTIAAGGIRGNRTWKSFTTHISSLFITLPLPRDEFTFVCATNEAAALFPKAVASFIQSRTPKRCVHLIATLGSFRKIIAAAARPDEQPAIHRRLGSFSQMPQPCRNWVRSAKRRHPDCRVFRRTQIGFELPNQCPPLGFVFSNPPATPELGSFGKIPMPPSPRQGILGSEQITQTLRNPL
jgi:hypothetical protein